MNKVAYIILSALLLVSFQASAFAKERVVLMPLQIENDGLRNTMESALEQGLRKRYTVISGERVGKKVRDIFKEESRKARGEVDETRALKRIAEAFQANLVAVALIDKRDDGYFVSMTIRTHHDNSVAFTKSEPCVGCDEYQLVGLLRNISRPPGKTFSQMMGFE